MLVYGLSALIKLVVQLGFVWLAFWSLKDIPWNKLISHFQKAKILHILLAIVIGYTTSNFFIGLFNLIIGYRP